MYNNPLISIIIPLFNKEKYIKRAINSIICQNIKDYEIIIVNDGSTDNSIKVVNELLIPGLKIISQSNSGPGAARNVGLRNSRGKYISFLDADDEWKNNFLFEGIEYLEKHSTVDVIAYLYKLNSSQNSMIPYWERKRKLVEGAFKCDNKMSPNLFGSIISFMCSSNLVIRKDILNKVGGFYDKNNWRFGEDEYLWIKMLLNGMVCISFKELVIVHDESSDLSNNSQSTRLLEAFLINPVEMLEYCPLMHKKLYWEFINNRIIELIKYYSKIGYSQKINELSNRYNSLTKYNRYRILYWSLLSNIIPTVRKIKSIFLN